MDDSYKIEKLTDCDWVNLFEVRFKRRGMAEKSWLMCSRKEKPIEDAAKADAVVIVATVETDEGRKLVVTKEFRVPIWDYEYGFPAGLIDDDEDIGKTVARELKEETGLELAEIKHVSTPVFSSAGLTDESCHMVLVEAKGQVSNKWLDDTEDIEVLLLDVKGIRDLLASNKKIAAKAWGLLYHYAKTGQID
ncbi:MAG: NUDIX hydrolase [Phycisphaerales bacterium]|nr:MAG: NUDIX hydrolase [Phycisphaerales bacterium]